MTPSRFFGHIMAFVVALIVFLLGIGIIAIILISMVWLINIIGSFANA